MGVIAASLRDKESQSRVTGPAQVTWPADSNPHLLTPRRVYLPLIWELIDTLGSGPGRRLQLLVQPAGGASRPAGRWRAGPGRGLTEQSGSEASGSEGCSDCPTGLQSLPFWKLFPPSFTQESSRVPLSLNFQNSLSSDFPPFCKWGAWPTYIMGCGENTRGENERLG